ncbi:c-type cytochrome biogenesis protein CcsB [Nesterenkonia populi]
MLTITHVNIELAEYSELFMLISAFIYALAFILFTVDAARSSQVIARLEAELSLEHSPVDHRPVLVGADEARDATPSGPGVEQDHLVNDEMSYGEVKRPLANVAVSLTVVAVLAHAFAVISRGVAASRWPMANMYEFLTASALVVAAVYVLALTRRDVRFLGLFVLGLVVSAMIAATIAFPTPVGHVQPALQSPWIAIHVTLAVLSMALFTLTFAMNILQLFQSKRENALEESVKTTGERLLTSASFFRLVPRAFSLENWSYRINAVGFVFWTIGPMITGAIWAYESWGRFWGWDPKEVWTFVIWVVYACYLHARATRGWTGNRAAWLSIIGFVCIIINYTVVNIWFPGLHSYAGLPE